MLNLKAVLEAAGTSLSSVVKANIYLTDLENFSAVNEIYSEFFPDMKPVSAWYMIQRVGHLLIAELFSLFRQGPALESDSSLSEPMSRLSA